MREQVVDEARKCMGGGHNSGLGTETSPHTPIEGPQAIVAATHRLCRQPEGLAGPIAGLERAPAQDLAPGDLVARGQSSPGTERLHLGPLVQIQTDLREDRLHGARMGSVSKVEMAIFTLPVQRHSG
jgi:hypothetical protein